MSQSKKSLGQFYTKNSAYITQGLLDVFPNEGIVVDPFVGEGDLLNIINNKTEMYDIDPKIKNTIKRDTLANPLDYKNKWIFTNPPYLAKNKNKDKTLYNLYNVDDLYKASILSIIGCEGGIIIIPLNFFSSDNGDTRKKFLSLYEVIKINVFEESVFDDTSYTICAFSFVKKENVEQSINFKFFPSGKELPINLFKKNGYKIGGEIYNLEQSDVKVSRLLIGQEKPNSKIFLNAIDTGTLDGMIRLSLREEPFYGKQTDRAFATIVFNRNFSLREQEEIVERFNKTLLKYRNKYNSMFLTNYRNSTAHMARKRIGFKLAYIIISNIIKNMENCWLKSKKML